MVEPGVVQDDCDLLSLVGLALKTIHHEGDLLGVLVSLDRVDSHFLGRQAQCPEERPARLVAVHVQLCSLPLGKPHPPRLGLVLDADLIDGVDLPAVLEQIDRPGPGSRPSAWRWPPRRGAPRTGRAA